METLSTAENHEVDNASLYLLIFKKALFSVFIVALQAIIFDY